jgi:negative regulator of flagellin synthesis FlgM
MEIEFTGLPSPQVQRNDSGLPNQGQAPAATPAPTSPTGDSVTLTREASAIQGVARQLDSMPVVDQDAVDSIREALSNGTYQIDPMRIAEKMTQFERGFYG